MCCLVALGTADGALAQIPDEFTNLQVLEKTISKPELVETMRGFATGLGVRCNYCHVGEDAETFKDFDWASDEKPQKETARVMLRMTRIINGEHIPTVSTKHEEPVEVRCVTCHRGQARPWLIQDLLTAAHEAGGMDSLVAKYEELRGEYYGQHTYDFGEFVIPGLIHQLAEPGNMEEGIKFFELNAKWFPESTQSLFMMGHGYLQIGEAEKALQTFERILEVDPENAAARGMVDRMKLNRTPE
jgi:tetratricopeptide (TPR) repeat protein